MIEGLGRPGALQPERSGANAKEPGSSFAQWLESKAAEVAERKSLDDRVGFEAADAAATIDFHFRRGQEAIEVVSVPWQLRASGRLSQHPGAFAVLAAAPAAGAAPLPAGTAKPAQTPQPASNAPAASLYETFQAQGPLFRSMQNNDDRTAMEAGGIDPAAPARTADAAPWAERLLRWLERQGHDPELWIRDYALDDKAAEQVAEAMRALAQEQGIRLERIVVNARELWRAPHPRQENV